MVVEVVVVSGGSPYVTKLLIWKEGGRLALVDMGRRSRKGDTQEESC